MIKVALVELGNGHDECLYAQTQFLKSVEGLELHLVCNQDLDASISYFSSDADHLELVSIRDRGLGQWVDLWRLRKYLIDAGFSHIIFNTAQGGRIKKLLTFPFPSSIHLSGTLHNINKLRNSRGQALISRRLQLYFLLNDYLLSQLQNEEKRHWPDLAVYYPIFFPSYPDAPIDKPEGEIWLCIPGLVELKRRDYGGLMEALLGSGLPPQMKLLFLGNSSHEYGAGKFLKAEAERLGISNQCMWWDERIDPALFHAVLRQSDYILPLIHKGHISAQLYQGQITGAFNLAFAYRIPLLMEEPFRKHGDFKANALFYRSGELGGLIQSLSSKEVYDWYKEEKWGFEYQKKAYLAALFNMT